MSTPLIIILMIYTALYIRGFVWCAHYYRTIFKGIQASGLATENFQPKVSSIRAAFWALIKALIHLIFVLAFVGPIFIVKTLIGFPVVGFGCLVVTQSIFEDKIRDKLVSGIVDNARRTLLGSEEQIRELENYLSKNLTV